MATVNPTDDDLRRAVEQVAALEVQLSAADDNGRAILRLVAPELRGIRSELQIPASGEIRSELWSALSAELRAGLLDRLRAVLELLRSGAPPNADTPKDPTSIMYPRHAANWVVHTLVGAGIALTTLVLFSVYSNWEDATACTQAIAVTPAAEPRAISGVDGQTVNGPTATPTATETATTVDASAPPPTLGAVQQTGKALAKCEQSALLMIFLMGALGGCLHWTSSLGKYIGNGRLLRRWVPYYVLMPFEGAALASLVYMLLRTGVLGSNASLAQLNLVSLYAFAGLTGLFSKQAIDMLADVFAVVFKRIQARDAIAHGAGNGASSSGPQAGGGSSNQSGGQKGSGNGGGASKG